MDINLVRAHKITPPVEMQNFASLLVSRGLFHPHLFARMACERILSRIPAVTLTQASSLAGLARRDLTPFRVLTLYFHEKTITPADLDCLRAFVASGGGLVAIHSAAASYKKQPAYADLLGGHFSAHGPISRFSVTPTSSAALPAAPLRPFAIRDERYRHRLVADVMVDYTSSAGDAPEPFAWRRVFGAGRIFYLAAGHTLSGLSAPSVQSILAAGLLWAAKATP